MKYAIISNPIKSTAITVVAMLALGAQQSSFAADANSGAFFGKNAPGKWIIGAKLAKIDPNTPDADITPEIEVGDADAVGIVVGYEFARAIGDGGGSSTIEFEYITGDDSLPASAINYDVDVANLFLTYRSPGQLYYKVKGGLSYTNFDINDQLGVERGFEDVSFGFGVGLGYKVGDLGVVELEYSTDTGDSDIDVIGINALLEF